MQYWHLLTSLIASPALAFTAEPNVVQNLSPPVVATSAANDVTVVLSLLLVLAVTVIILCWLFYRASLSKTTSGSGKNFIPIRLVLLFLLSAAIAGYSFAFVSGYGHALIKSRSLGHWINSPGDGFDHYMYFASASPLPPMGPIDTQDAPIGADATYLPAARSAVAKCGDQIALLRYEPRRSPNGGEYMFTPGTCAPDTTANSIMVDYDNTGHVADPWVERALLSNAPIPLSDWEISADKAVQIASSNGGQPFLLATPGAELQQLMLEKNDRFHGFVWRVAFGGWPKSKYEMIFEIDPKTGEVKNKWWHEAIAPSI